MGKAKILYVDDEEYNLILFDEIFNKRFDIYTTFSAKEGIEILENKKIDLIISDQRMPKMSGVEFLKYAFDKYPEPKRILLTADTGILTIKKAINEANIFQYVQKPWREDDLLIIIERALEIYFLEKENKKQKEELIKAKEEAEKNEQRLKKLSDLTIEGIIIHKKGIIIDVNRSMLSMTAYKAEEMIGKNIIDLIIPKENHQSVYQRINEKYIAPHENTILRKDRQHIPVEIEAFDVLENDEIIRVSSFRDITKRKENEKEIKKLSTAVEQSYNTIVITDINGNIEYTNPQFTLITGYTTQEVLGKNPRILNAGTQEKGYYSKMWEKISGGDVWMGKFHNKTKNGNFYWERVIITPLKNNEGEIISYMAIKEDITESLESKKRIINAIIEAEERERNHFSKELHDGLGPVLSTLKMYFEWMSKTEDKEKKELIITNGILNIDEAISIVDEISNKLTPRTLNAFGFPAALETFIGRLKVSETKINLTSNFDKRLETNHEAAIYRVLTELINNTLKHAKAKNIHISIKYKFTEKNLKIEYFDDGVGFDYREKLERGGGFGLINMQQRIKTFNGSIKFNTKIGKGLKVFITFDQIKES